MSKKGGYAARFEFGLFNGPDDPRDAALSFRAVEHGCTMLYRCNVDYCNAYGRQRVPDLYSTVTTVIGRQPLIRYQTPEDACGGDVWQDIPTLLARRYGDCKDLACYLAAYRTVFDLIPSVPRVRRRWMQDGFALYHVVVENLVDGIIEDPSMHLGMPPALGA